MNKMIAKLGLSALLLMAFAAESQAGCKKPMKTMVKCSLLKGNEFKGADDLIKTDNPIVRAMADKVEICSGADKNVYLFMTDGDDPGSIGQVSVRAGTGVSIFTLVQNDSLRFVLGVRGVGTLNTNFGSENAKSSFACTK